MDSLITNGVDPALLRVVEKRSQERDPGTQRKRALVPMKHDHEEDDNAPDPDVPKHSLDDLA
jgi:hypothetical protein